MRSVLYAVLVGLVGAGLVHGFILFGLPIAHLENVWSRLAQRAATYRLVDLNGPDEPIVATTDPLFRALACRFDLADGPLRILSLDTVPYWSISLRDETGQTIYSLNDKVAVDGDLDVVILSDAQMVAFRRELPPELEGSILVETPLRRGIMLLRAFRPDDSWDGEISRFLSDLSCSPA